MPTDYRMSIYLGAGEDGKRLNDVVEKLGALSEFRESKMEFVRHCIRYTLEHDPVVKKLSR